MVSEIPHNETVWIKRIIIILHTTGMGTHRIFRLCYPIRVWGGLKINASETWIQQCWHKPVLTSFSGGEGAMAKKYGS